MASLPQQVAQLCRGCEKLFTESELRAKLLEERPLRVKLGVDPTAPDIHLGHSVVLSKLRDFQDLGHEAILIIGDFTAMIGDPSGRSVTRPHLTHEQVLHNAMSYQEQAFKILSRERAKIVFNGEWFKSMCFEDVIKLNSRVTLQQMLVREDFRERLDHGKAIGAHEIQYPIMQGWDSVMIKADVELGGTDQLFNIMVGRDLQREKGMSQQVAMVMPILEGLDGKQKMSKSLENYVALNESPAEMFGKLMSISDELMAHYYNILVHEDVPPAAHPMEAKKSLARRVTERFHSPDEAAAALQDFERRFSRRDLEHSDLPVFSPTGQLRDFISVVVEAYARCFGIAKSRSEVRRLIEGGSVRWEGEKIAHGTASLPADSSGVLKLDKTHAVRIL